jgi:hypothetical protein
MKRVKRPVPFVLVGLFLFALGVILFSNRNQDAGSVISDESPKAVSSKTRSGDHDVVSGAESEKPTGAGSNRISPRIRSALVAARKQFEEIERKRAKVLQEFRTASDTTTVVTIQVPTREDLEAYGISLTSTIDGFEGSEADENILRTKAHELMKEFTDYPLPLKVLHLSASPDGKMASFIERFARSEDSLKVDEVTSSFTSESDEYCRDDDWNQKDSWARRRYNYLFSIE